MPSDQSSLLIWGNYMVRRKPTTWGGFLWRTSLWYILESKDAHVYNFFFKGNLRIEELDFFFSSYDETNTEKSFSHLYSIYIKKGQLRCLCLTKHYRKMTKWHESCVLHFVFALFESCFVFLFTFFNLSTALALINTEFQT